jgi:FkbM family methyltransferase
VLTVRRAARSVVSRLPDGIGRLVRTQYHVRRLKRLRVEDEAAFGIIAKLVARGDCVIDVGANYGTYTKLLSDLVGLDGTVYAIEPVPATFGIISAVVRRLGLSNVRPMQCAVSDRVGDALIEIPRRADGRENYYTAKLIDTHADPSLRYVRTRTVTLDDAFASADHRPSFIKCDVEGHELRCVLGAKAILSARPAWYMEVSSDPDTPGTSARELFRVLAEESYEPFWLDGDRLRRWKAGVSSVDYFFLHERHLERLDDLTRQ